MSNNNNNNNKTIEITNKLQYKYSSHKDLHGISMIFDNNFTTYYETKGLQPHFINVYSQNYLYFDSIKLYLDYSMDESYTINVIN